VEAAARFSELDPHHAGHRPLGFWRRRVVAPFGAGTTWIDQNLLLMM
jgi:hypothetical protein